MVLLSPARVGLLVLAGLSAAVGQDHWAVLVAGSREFYNYRHQADICHAYQVLTKRGFDPEKIITMVFDDVANSSENPFPGRLYNRPAKTMKEAVDVYAGCKKDYTGSSITPETFLAVLSGDEKKAKGKVLKSTAKDHVFVNFVDHGGVGLIAFPDMDQVLHAKTLVTTLESMYKKGMYKQLAFYLETCESGSMFQGLLPESLPVYTLTAANAKESSWGTYCGDASKVGGKTLGTCLGDLFSVNWMQDSEGLTGAKETLGQQYLRVKKATNMSHVMHYGQVEAFSKETTGDFQGSGKGLLQDGQAPLAPTSSMRAREVKLQHLVQAFQRTGTAEAAARVHQELQDLSAVNRLGLALAKGVLGAEAESGPLESTISEFSWTPELLQCHEKAVEVFGKFCGWSENRLKLSQVLFQLCQRQPRIEKVLGGIRTTCPSERVGIYV